MSSPITQRLSGQDPVMLVRIAAAISLMAAGTRDYGYNFPLFLFGLVSFELSSTNCLQFFLSIVLFSGLFDLLFILFGLRGPSIILGIVLAFLKAPIYFSGLAALRERGGDLNWASRGFGPFGSMGSGWSSLPTAAPQGGVSTQSDPAPPGYFPSFSGPSFPSGGQRLGGDEGASSQPQPKGRGGYEAIA